jgi:hypothetical protein
LKSLVKIISICPPLKIDAIPTYGPEPAVCGGPSGLSVKRGGPDYFDNPGGKFAPFAVKRGPGWVSTITYLVPRNWLYRGLLIMRSITKNEPYMMRMRPQVHRTFLISRRAGGASRFMKGVIWNS